MQQWYPENINVTSRVSILIYQKKKVGYFQRLLKGIETQSVRKKKIVTISDKTQEASFRVAEFVATKMKPHTVAEDLIFPACPDIVRILFGEDAATEICKIPLSNDTIKRRIDVMSANIGGQVSKILRYSNMFALQVDESTDVSAKSQLFTFIRTIHEGDIVENFFFCQEMSETTKGSDIFQVVDEYLKKINVSWSTCVGICTNEARAMTGFINGFIRMTKDKNKNIIPPTVFYIGRHLWHTCFRLICETS